MRFGLGCVITKTQFQKHTLVFGFKIQQSSRVVSSRVPVGIKIAKNRFFLQVLVWRDERTTATAGTTVARYRREKQTKNQRVFLKRRFCKNTP